MTTKIPKLLTFEIISRANRNEQYGFRLFKTTWRFNLQMSSGIFQWWISPEVEFTPVMTDFPSSAIDGICGALNRLVSGVIINWHAQRAQRKMSFISLAKRLTCNGMYWIVGIVKILKNGTMEITNIEIYRLKFILKRHVFVLHVTSVNTGSVQVTHRAVGARTMHGFGTDLVRNLAIWLVEIRD